MKLKIDNTEFFFESINFPKLKEWIDALKSGEYKHGTKSLYEVGYDESDNKCTFHCCLGVLCKINGYAEAENFKQHRVMKKDTMYTNNSDVPDNLLREIFTLKEYDSPRLTCELGLGKSFAAINDKITTTSYEPIIEVLEQILALENS